MGTSRSVLICLVLATPGAFLVNTVSTQAAERGASPEAKRVIEFWTKARRDSAIPRDLVIDERGLGYLRKPDGSLEPYGHSVAATKAPAPTGKPVTGDTTPPVISQMSPANGATIGATAAFSAKVTDSGSGVKSVSFVITYPSGQTQSFGANAVGNDTWQINFSGFSDGSWGWQVVAKDNGDKGGNTATSDVVHFSVDTSSSGGNGGGGTGSYIVTNAEWNAEGAVQTAAGRLYFQMPNNARRNGPWTGYVCSGTVATDGEGDRSIIITAAHCVYDDSNKAFARNVLFIPNQAGTTGTRTDTNCSNDPMGCWVPTFGVVDVNWTTRTFPANIPWDYAYYVVSDAGAHVGTAASSDNLESAAGSLDVQFFSAAIFNDDNPSATSPDFTHALGYSYSDDPKFMYCAEDMTVEGSYNDYWLASCGLSGGSSGGPWVQPMDETTGSGPIVSVNSWGYTNSPGMAGPRLFGSSAYCVFTSATKTTFAAVPTADGDAGVATSCP